MAVKDPWLEEQAVRRGAPPAPFLATVEEADPEKGVKLAFDGEKGASPKYYQCNAAVKFARGQRVKVDKHSGTFVVDYPLGLPAEEIEADRLRGYTLDANADTGVLSLLDHEGKARAVQHAAVADLAAQAQDSLLLDGQRREALAVGSAREAQHAQSADHADLAGQVRAYTRTGAHYVELRPAGEPTDNAVGLIGNGSTTDYSFIMINFDRDTCDFYGSLHERSSRRFKTNIRSLTDAEARAILRLRPVHFDYLRGPGDRFGLLAEEAALVQPQGIGRDEAGLPADVEYTQYIPPILRLLQLQQAELDQLRARVDMLEGNYEQTDI